MKISIKEAQRITSAHMPEQGIEVIPLMESCGRILAEDIIAEISQPPFRRSAMDGYALYKEDYVAGVSLPVACEIDAGDIHSCVLEPGTAVRIMTGARLPEGANLVVRQEDTDYGEDFVLIKKLPQTDNICPVGEDFLAGETLVEKGRKIDAQTMACIAAAGKQRVAVYRPPRVMLLTTGTELTEPGMKLKLGQIYNSNLVYLSARLLELGCRIVCQKQVEDNEQLIERELLKAEGSVDYIITTGGVSVGKKDFMEQILQKMDARILFHGIAIKPGMPTMFSMLGKIPVLSLSGNPYAASCLFEYLFPYHTPLCIETVLANSFKKPRPCLRIVRGFFDGKGVTVFVRQRNGATKEGVQANCFVELPAGDKPVPEGEKVVIFGPWNRK
ncbi:MAG: molybdopterin molybdotransferase MoeA [Acetivibrio ethanolgignens]